MAALLIFVAAILQVTIFAQLDILGGYPDVVLLTLMAIALLRGSIYGAALGFFAGLIVDTANLGTLGLTSLLLTIAGYWIGRYGETTGRDRLHAPFVSVAVATVLFPSLARAAARGDTPEFRRTVSLGLRQIAFLLVPAAVVVREDVKRTAPINYLLGDDFSAKTVMLHALPAKVLLNLLLTLPVYAAVRRLLALGAPVETVTEVQLLG